MRGIARRLDDIDTLFITQIYDQAYCKRVSLIYITIWMLI